jgi:hypothetical protein
MDGAGEGYLEKVGVLQYAPLFRRRCLCSEPADTANWNEWMSEYYQLIIEVQEIWEAHRRGYAIIPGHINGF